MQLMNTNASQLTHNKKRRYQPNKSQKNKKITGAEQDQLQKIALYFVICLTMISEGISLIVFLSSHSIEAAALFQIQPIVFISKIVNYLFPGPDIENHPLLALLRMIRKGP